jgi:hypothetical protein
VRAVNGLANQLMDAPVLGNLVRRGLVKIRYVGRRSGKDFEVLVGYRRSGDTIAIGVQMPDRKNWAARSPSSASTAGIAPVTRWPPATSGAAFR